MKSTIDKKVFGDALKQKVTGCLICGIQLPWTISNTIECAFHTKTSSFPDQPRRCLGVKSAIDGCFIGGGFVISSIGLHRENCPVFRKHPRPCLYVVEVKRCWPIAFSQRQSSPMQLLQSCNQLFPLAIKIEKFCQ